MILANVFRVSRIHTLFQSIMPAYLTFDIFCTVIDNYGDIGVSWRLARQLVQEHGCAVRLWVDDLRAFQRLCPDIEPDEHRQTAAGVAIWHWQPNAPLPADWSPGDVVIEAFGSDLPSGVLQAMAARQPVPVWLNLEYLSAEAWVREHHGLSSPHPQLPLVRHFFFPGFEHGTGGLLHETGLEEQRRAFQSGPAARQRLWHQLAIDAPPRDACVVSLFAYRNPALRSLLQQWHAASQPVVCLVPEGPASAQIRQLLEGASHATAQQQGWRTGALTVQPIPFVRQERYDDLLWACDANFVRGEDSFVRAQWAQQPFVWQIYPQDEQAHLIKLEAFLTHYLACVPHSARDAIHTFWRAWNDPAQCSALDWQAFHATFAAQRSCAQRWSSRLLTPGDLAANLVEFCENRLK